MSESRVLVPTRVREQSHLGVAITLLIVVGFFISATLIGNTYSCTPIANLYYLGGVLSLPILFALPIVFAPKLHIMLRVCLSFLNAGLGVVTWAWAHDAAGMTFMCRLF